VNTERGSVRGSCSDWVTGRIGGRGNDISIGRPLTPSRGCRADAGNPRYWGAFGAPWLPARASLRGARGAHRPERPRRRASGGGACEVGRDDVGSVRRRSACAQRLERGAAGWAWSRGGLKAPGTLGTQAPGFWGAMAPSRDRAPLAPPPARRYIVTRLVTPLYRKDVHQAHRPGHAMRTRPSPRDQLASRLRSRGEP
jgi:hypothetical protein